MPMSTRKRRFSNPNKQAEEDTRTPAELLDIIEQKGREVAEAVAALRAI